MMNDRGKTYTNEMQLAAVRWVKRYVPVPGLSAIFETEHELQQAWELTDYGNPEKLGVPIRVRTEWRDVPTVEEGK